MALKSVGVVGCGLMGSGIVEVAARAGVDVIFVEPTDDLVAAGRSRIEGSTTKAVERGKLSSDDRKKLGPPTKPAVPPAAGAK